MPKANTKCSDVQGSVPGDRPEPCSLIIFGASGDLTRRKIIPAVYSLAEEGTLPASFAVVGFARRDKPGRQFAEELADSTAEYNGGQSLDADAWKQLAENTHYVQGTFEDSAGYARLKKKLKALDKSAGTCGNRIFYLATPPSAFPVILDQLKAAGLLSAPGSAPWTRVIIEKPFGHDLASARELNAQVASTLAESQIYRIDHYLGKETVQNILVFRFGNSIFEPIWNRKYIDHIQITMAESIGVVGRGGFYDKAGVLRDIIQNHLLQVLALVAMEQPVTFEANHVRDERVKVFKSLRPIRGNDVHHNVVHGQYEGYLGEAGVESGSRTPTYAALRVHLDNWRWQGVPFYLRAGKGLAKRVTEVAIHFQSVPLCLFGHDEVCQRLEPNVLRLRIQPDEGINLSFACKVPGDELAVSSVTMDFGYAEGFNVPVPSAYERLILDCMRGDATLFARSDGVEAAWNFITPILETWEAAASSPADYVMGAQGPKEADKLLGADGRRWGILE